MQAGPDIPTVQDLLGHSAVSTTQIYTHMNRGETKEKSCSSQGAPIKSRKMSARGERRDHFLIFRDHSV